MTDDRLDRADDGDTTDERLHRVDRLIAEGRHDEAERLLLEVQHELEATPIVQLLRDVPRLRAELESLRMREADGEDVEEIERLLVEIKVWDLQGGTEVWNDRARAEDT
jgi:hypothetical protein